MPKGKAPRSFIAGAGGAAHLAGVIASHSMLPVIGVPLPTLGLGGFDALLATVQMPTGFPWPPSVLAMRAMPHFWRCRFWPSRMSACGHICSLSAQRCRKKLWQKTKNCRNDWSAVHKKNE